MEFLIRKDDLVVAISSSGNSKNIINAINVAHKKGAEVITLTGFKPENQAKQLLRMKIENRVRRLVPMMGKPEKPGAERWS